MNCCQNTRNSFKLKRISEKEKEKKVLTCHRRSTSGQIKTQNNKNQLKTPNIKHMFKSYAKKLEIKIIDSKYYRIVENG